MAAKKVAKKKAEKITASKKIIIASYVIGAILTGVTVTGAFLGFDVSTIGMVTTAAYAEIAASNAFYFSKAKKENVLKIALSAIQDVPAEKVDDAVKMVSTIGGVV
ncbi:MAG: hypothetical protein OSJ43_12495 [Oscillospiraceae bacterium]|nr:hypothetical protein [Oscillospiraceae bacterium]